MVALSKRIGAKPIFYSVAITIALLHTTVGFAPGFSNNRVSPLQQRSSNLPWTSRGAPLFKEHDLIASSSQCTRKTTGLSMSNNKAVSGILTATFIVGALLFFVVSAFAPLIDYANTSPSSTDLNLGDSVVTRQDGDKLKIYASKFDALSANKIQEKLSNLPVFYVSNGDGSGVMANDNFYLSYDEAQEAIKQSSGSDNPTVKVTTLDQVMYPLILKKETPSKTISKAPLEIKNAVQSNKAQFKLIPSASSLQDAQKTETSLKPNIDLPLFVVERLAFAGNDGRPQVPLFTEMNDALTSYARLREGGKSSLPEEPTIRTTSLMDVLDSMERGTRPGVGQLEFYGRAEDVLKAAEMSQ